jgi:hypothetical protein
MHTWVFLGVIHKRWESFMVDGLGNIFAKRLLLTVFIAIMGIVKTNHANIQFSKNLKEKIISSRPVCLSLTKIIEISLAAQDDEEFSYFLSSILDKTIQFDQNDTRIDLAHKWLENSANHIFNDPYRAPAEWIANAIDATVAKKGTGNPVGKFGLGFFSGLCFLLHQEQFWPNTDTLASLSIITSAKDGDVYHVIMTRTADKKDLTVTFLALSRKQKAVFFNQLHNLDVQSPKTGTIITLLPPAGQTLSDTMIYGIQDYFHYFDVYPHVTTIVNVQDNNQNRTRAYIGGYNKASSISVSLTPQEFSVMDTGTGISLETMISCLFVPSSSTKRIPEQVNNVQHTTDTTDIALPKYIDFLGKKDNTQSHFLITVNGIVVIDKPLDTPIFDENNTLKDIIMSMPQKTRLTVARDEVYIAPHAVSFEETYLKSVINKTIDHCFTTTTQQSLLLALYKGLSCWENKSSAHHIKGLFTSYFRQQLEHVINQQENLVPVPQELYASAILKDIEHGSTRIFPLDPELICYTYQKAEAFLTKTLKNSNAIALKGVAGTLISGKKVFFVSIPHITSLGLRNCLFVPEHFLTGKNEQEVVNAISACVTEQDLLPPTHNQFTASTLLVTNKNHSWCNIPTEFYHMQVLYKKIKDKHEPFSFKHTKILKDVFVKNMELFSNVYMWLFAFHEHSFNLSRFLADSSINSEPYKKTIMDLDILTQGIIDNASSFSVTKWSETISRFEGFFFDPETITFYRYNGNTQALKITGARIQNLLEKSEVIVRDIKEEILRPYSFEEVSIVDVANTFATALGLLIGFVTYDGISFSYDTNNVYFSGDLQLWPCEKKQMNIEAMFITFTCMALEYYLKRSKQQGVPFFLDNIQHTAIVHFLSQLRQGTSSMILSFPGYNQEELKTLIDLCETDYAWAKSLQPYLARSFQAINIPGYLEEIIGWLLYVVGPHSTINKKMQQKVIDVKSSLLGLYQRFFTIDFSLFPHTYGQEIIFKTIQSERDVTNINQTVYDVLEMLSHNESALNKLFTFVVADFSLKTESEKQRQDLAAQCLYVPTVMANTPLSLLAVLKERLKNDTLAYKIIQVIIEKSRSVQELAFISYIFLDEQILNVLRTIEPARHDELANICAYLFTHYIQEKIDPQRLDELYEKNRKTVSLAHRIANINDEVVGTLVKQYIQERATQTETPWGNTTTAYNNDIIQKTAPKSTVLLSQLLKAHCAGTGIYELLRQEKLQQALTKIKTFSAQTNLGKINQCIEAGSEKSALTATLVECLQNAIDAANDVYKKTGSADMINTIIFTLETMKKPETNSCSLCLSIKDYVGFDKFVTLLTDFLLPDFSNKAPQNGTIGTMGNGSFKMYQQAQTVSILTRIRQSKHCFHLLITPLRYTHNKQVYDLQISCKDVTSAVDGEFVGTDIKVTFLEEPDDVIRMNMLSIRDFLTTTIGATHACLTGSSIPFIMYERDGKGGLHRINQTTQVILSMNGKKTVKLFLKF